MQVCTRHTPSFGVARLMLAAGESAGVESGAMLATSYGLAVDTRSGGGMLAAARAAFGGEHSSAVTYTASGQSGWVDVAPSLPGDLDVLELDGQGGWCVSRQCWLAAASTTRAQVRWSGFRNLFGGEEGFLTHITGQGPLVVCCYGALDVVTLSPGEFVTIDAGHLVAYADSVQSRLRQLEQGGAQSLRTGAGLVFDFAGPGRVLTQTRDPRGLAAWLRHHGSAGR